VLREERREQKRRESEVVACSVTEFFEEKNRLRRRKRRRSITIVIVIIVSERNMSKVEPGTSSFYVYIVVIVGLVLFAGMMSGLTLGLMSLGLVDLEVLVKSGQPSDRKHAGKELSFLSLLCPVSGRSFFFKMFLSFFFFFSVTKIVVVVVGLHVQLS
jgi:metal transporter CNNM